MSGRVLVLFLAVAAGSGCVGISGIRNGPVRNRMRSATHVVDRDLSKGTVTVERDDDVTDASRPYGFGVAAKMGVIYGGAEDAAHGGYTQDLGAYVVAACGRWYVAPQLAFTMSIHGSSMMKSSQMALAFPLELEGGVRVLDRVALYGAGGRSIWGSVHDGDVSSGQTFWRGRAGGLFVLRNGSYEHFEISLRLEGFATSGSGDKLDYSAVGGLIQLDFTGTGSGY